MHFGENQLSLSLIGLSPLPTGHPPGFQPWWVRASTPSYRRFTLPMARSLRFGSRARDYDRPVRTRFRYGSVSLTLLVTVSRRIIMQKAPHQAYPCGHSPLSACRHVVSGSLSSPCRGSSHLSLALLGSLSVAREYLALRDGPRRFRPASTCRVLLRCQTDPFPCRLQDFHLLWSNIPERLD